MSTVPGWVTLTEGEEVVWAGGPSAAQLARSLVWAVLVVVAGLIVAALGPSQLSGAALAAYDDLRRVLRIAGFVIGTVGLLIGLVAYLRYESIDYLVTTEELYVKRGFLSRSVRNLRLDRVQDTGFTQTAPQRLLGFGDVHVSTAGGSGVELVFGNVPDPASVNAIVAEQLDAVRPPRGEPDAEERTDRRRDDRRGDDRRGDDYRREDSHRDDRRGDDRRGEDRRSDDRRPELRRRDDPPPDDR
jgi:uncharacterized membrane protein YdbT with pleckstrin-like domain